MHELQRPDPLSTLLEGSRLLIKRAICSLNRVRTIVALLRTLLISTAELGAAQKV